jgi:ribosome-binding factor A
MRVQMDTKDRTIYVSANDIAHDLETVDKWLKAMKVAREWLRKELAAKEIP